MLSLGRYWTTPHTSSKVLLAIYRVLWAKIGILKQRLGGRQLIVHRLAKKAVSLQMKTDRGLLTPGMGFLKVFGQNREKTMIGYISVSGRKFSTLSDLPETHREPLGGTMEHPPGVRSPRSAFIWSVTPLSWVQLGYLRVFVRLG